MSRNDKISRYCTNVVGNHTRGMVQYHRTVIVEWTPETITLRSDGYETVTTKRKMNQCSREFSLGFGVHQRKGVWYVSDWDGSKLEWNNEREFQDGMTFPRR